MFYGMSKNKEYFEKTINLFVGLAPVMRLKHQYNGLISELTSDKAAFDKYLNEYKAYEVYGPGWKTMINILCVILPNTCIFNDIAVVWLQSQYNVEERISAYTSKFP